jgi:hypothetical protein
VGTRTLDRRDLLKLAATSSVAGALDGCAPRQAAPRTAASIAADLDPQAAEATLSEIDRRLAWIDQETFADDIVPLSRLRQNEALAGQLQRDTMLVRKSMRSLYLTGRFLDMPEELRVHPGVQARLLAMQGDMDDAVLGMTDRLERMTDEDHRRVRDRLTSDPMLAERIAQALERTAAEDGMSFERRFGVRASILDLAGRMRAQSPALVTDPLVRKVRRIQARPRSGAAEERRLAAQIGEEAFWEHQKRMATLHDAWALRLAAYQAPQRAAASAPAEEKPRNPHAGDRTISTGGYVMGFGFASVVVGLIFAGLASAFSAPGLYIPAVVLGITIGPILLIVGLIMVIVGAIENGVG